MPSLSSTELRTLSHAQQHGTHPCGSQPNFRRPLSMPFGCCALAVGVLNPMVKHMPIHALGPLTIVTNHHLSAGHQETLAYAATGVLLVVAFFAARIVLVAYYWHSVLSNFDVGARLAGVPGVCERILEIHLLPGQHSSSLTSH